MGRMRLRLAARNLCYGHRGDSIRMPEEKNRGFSRFSFAEDTDEPSGRLELALRRLN